jgi:hypothetical protein
MIVTQFKPLTEETNGYFICQSNTFGNTHAFAAFGITQGDHCDPRLNGQGEMAFFQTKQLPGPEEAIEPNQKTDSEREIFSHK